MKHKKLSKYEYEWEEELSELAEKYCKHDNREMNSCLYWIFRPLIIKVLKEERNNIVKMVEGIVGEDAKMQVSYKTAREISIGMNYGYNKRGKEIRKKIKDIINTIKDNG